jgi:hypothetical protein
MGGTGEKMLTCYPEKIYVGVCGVYIWTIPGQRNNRLTCG